MASADEREGRLRQELADEGLGLVRDDDGLYRVTQYWEIASSNGLRVRTYELNEGAENVESLAPMTLDGVEDWMARALDR